MGLFSKKLENPNEVFYALAMPETDHAKAASEFCQSLWSRYECYADSHFLVEIQRDFWARYWEMYLACTLMDVGWSISSCDIGPDLRIESDGHTIWIEAVAPSAGDGVDRVPGFLDGRSHSVPEEQILLRYRSVIEEKYNKKRVEYIQGGIVSDQDPFVVAIFSTSIGYSLADFEPARIVRAVYPIGMPFISHPISGKGEAGYGNSFRGEINKSSGASVSLTPFLSEGYSGLSAVLESNADPFKKTTELGKEMALVHNCRADNPLPLGFLRTGREYTCECRESEFSIKKNDLF